MLKRAPSQSAAFTQKSTRREKNSRAQAEMVSRYAPQPAAQQHNAYSRSLPPSAAMPKANSAEAAAAQKAASSSAASHALREARRSARAKS